MKNRLEGIVIEVRDQIAKVKVKRHSDCSSCGSCPGEDAVELDAFNGIGALPGCRVVVEMESDAVVNSVFIVFILPLVFVALGVYGGVMAGGSWSNGQLLPGIVGGVIGLVLAVFCILHAEHSLKVKQNLPTIIQLSN